MPAPAPATVIVEPARSLRGRLRVPGDKSISHRYALLAALANGPSRLSQYAPGADCRSTLQCLAGLGVPIEGQGEAFTIVGRGLGGLRSPAHPLDAGNSGSTMRMLAGILAAHPFTSQMGGDPSLSRRPMRRVIEPLSRMGATIASIDGHAPLTITGASLHGISHRPEVPSAQVKSAVLLAGLHAAGTTSVVEPAQTRDHTERAFDAFGAAILREADGIEVVGGQPFDGQTLSIPGDFSSAAFWMVAAAALPGSCIEIEDVGLNPTRTGLIDVLRRFGARVTVSETTVTAGEPRGTLVVEAGDARTVVIAPEEVPILIDELPAVAALAVHAGEVVVSGAAELRVKESDRIASLVAGFRALGIEAEERPDGFTIHATAAPRGGVADARGDHRLAMAFAIAALAGRGPSRIEGSDAVAVSYPEFFETLQRLVA